MKEVSSDTVIASVGTRTILGTSPDRDAMSDLLPMGELENDVREVKAVCFGWKNDGILGDRLRTDVFERLPTLIL